MRDECLGLVGLAGVRIQGRFVVTGDVVEESLAGVVGCGGSWDRGGLAEEKDESEEEGSGEEEGPEIS